MWRPDTLLRAFMLIFHVICHPSEFIYLLWKEESCGMEEKKICSCVLLQSSVSFWHESWSAAVLKLHAQTAPSLITVPRNSDGFRERRLSQTHSSGVYRYLATRRHHITTIWASLTDLVCHHHPPFFTSQHSCSWRESNPFFIICSFVK